MKLALSRVAELTLAAGNFSHEIVAEGYSIDSRTIQPGELFIAVKGESLDGHDYVERAIAKGACAAIVDKHHLARFATQQNLLVVPDTLVALQSLGAAVRRLWNKPVIAVTGSAGKTTTKEAIAHLLSKRYRVLKSQGNLNNHFGLPLQLLKIEPQHDLAVIEMGMSNLGEIAALAKIAKPDTGVVTCVAPVHLQSFNSLADVARAKFELIESIHAGGIAVLNADDAYVSQFGRDFHGEVITFGVTHPADVRAENIEQCGASGSRFSLVVDGIRESVELPMLGLHNVMNALAAAATATHYQIAPSQIAAALAELSPSDKRGEMFSLGGATIINDCYNSNPTALNSMVDALATIPSQRRIVVAGEMLELGPSGEKLHYDCGAHMAGKVDMLIGVRGLAVPMVKAAHEAGINAHFVPTPEEAGDMLSTQLRSGDVVLFKASRGVKLERAIQTLQDRLKDRIIQ